MIIIFEDDIGTPSSKLLAQCMPVGSMKFAKGYKNIRNEILNSIHDDELIVAYIDVMPDNKASYIEYNKLQLEFSIYANIYVYPMFCIEHAILYFVNSMVHRADLTNFLADAVIPAFIPKAEYDRLVTACNYEHWCKSVLSYFADMPNGNGYKWYKCLMNKSSNNSNSQQACFYDYNCDNATDSNGVVKANFCNTPTKCGLNCRYSLLTKSVKLHGSLPIYHLPNNYAQMFSKKQGSNPLGDVQKWYDRLILGLHRYNKDTVKGFNITEVKEENANEFENL